jgi:hypothetical protein
LVFQDLRVHMENQARTDIQVFQENRDPSDQRVGQDHLENLVFKDHQDTGFYRIEFPDVELDELLSLGSPMITDTLR